MGSIAIFFLVAKFLMLNLAYLPKILILLII